MVAKVEHHLVKNFGGDLSGRKVSVFGATGPVGGCAAVIAAKYGANVELVSHHSLTDAEAKAVAYNQRYGIQLTCADGGTEESKQKILQSTEIALCCAAAGARVITLTQMAASSTLKIVADVNAVAPSGAEGVDVMADGVAIADTKAYGIGALAIGNLKYTTQHNLLKQMLEARHYLDFISAFEMARASIK